MVSLSMNTDRKNGCLPKYCIMLEWGLVLALYSSHPGLPLIWEMASFRLLSMISSSVPHLRTCFWFAGRITLLKGNASFRAGMSGCWWNDYLKSITLVLLILFKQLQSLAELLWCKQNKTLQRKEDDNLKQRRTVSSTSYISHGWWNPCSLALKAIHLSKLVIISRTVLCELKYP